MLVLDDAPFPDMLDRELQLSLRQNPGNLMLLTPTVVVDFTSIIQISVRTIDAVSSQLACACAALLLPV